MKQLASTYPVIAKALRILLTFSLVFFTSLHVERMAFAAEAPTVYTNEPTDGFISAVTIYEVKSETDYAQIASTNNDKPGSTSIAERQGQRVFVAIASWEDKDGKALTTDENKPWLTYATSLVDWTPSGDVADFAQNKDAVTVTAKGTADGNYVLDCKLKDSVLANKAGRSLKHTNAIVEIALSNQPEPTPEPEPDPEPEPKQDPYITSIQILDDQGNPIEGRTLSLAPEQTTYAFQARVAIVDPEATIEEGQAITVTCTPELGLGAALQDVQFVSGFQFQDSDISWSVGDTESASITPQGILTTPTDGSTFTVSCTTDKGENVGDTVTVITGEPEKEDPYVTSLQLLKSDGTPFEDGEELEITNDEPSEEGATSEQGTYQFQVRVAYFNPAEEAETIYIWNGSEWSIEGGEATTNPFEITWEPTDKVTPTGLLTLRPEETTAVRCFTVNGKNGESHEDTITVRNTSPAQPQPQDAKVTIGYTPVAKDQEAILTALPEGVDGFTYHLSWERSTDEGATWEPTDETEEAISVMTDDEHIGQWYRVVMTIDGVEEPINSEHVVISIAEDTGPSVTIAYTPVAKDETTTLVAEPKNIEDMEYEIVWEESTDNGGTWSTVADATELTLSVTTDDEHIGRQYRVTLNIKDREEPVQSEPVTIRAKDETRGVVVAYDAVPLGQAALLQAVPRNIGNATPHYDWELSTDQGTTWNSIEQSGVTVSIPTDKDHLGQRYRVAMRLDDSEEVYYSNVVEIVDGTDDGQPKVVVLYDPVPKGEVATLIQFPKNVGPLTWYAFWEESTDGGASWHELSEESQQLDVMTDDEHIGRQYRARNDVIEPTESTMYSNVVTIVEGEPKFRVRVRLDYRSTGQTQTLVSDVSNIPDGSKEDLTYIWEVSHDDGTTYEIIQSGYYPTLDVVTDSDVLGNLYRVRVRTPQGAEAISLPQKLAAIEEAGSDPAPEPDHVTPLPPEPEEIIPDPSDIDYTEDDTSNQESTDTETVPATDDNAGNEPPSQQDQQQAEQNKPAEQKQPEQQQQAKPEEQKKPETMSEMADTYGSIDFAYDDGSIATMSPLDSNIESVTMRELMMQEQKPNLLEVVQSNPFGQLLIPFCLAVMAAGALEKWLRFREQRRPSLAAF